MAYKKYIVKNGKTYGPYIYQSKRVNGKVVSEYIGPQSTKKERRKIPKRPILILLGIFFLVTILFFTFSNTKITGKVIVDIEGNLEDSQITAGKINFLINEGELIPQDSKIIIENENQSFEYVLKDIIDQAQLVSGKYYIKDEEIEGEGEGYGLAGEFEEKPEINFDLIITQEETKEEESQEENNASENESNQTINETGQIPEENNSSEIENNATQEETQEENNSSEIENDTVQDSPEETSQDETKEEEEVVIEVPLEENSQDESLNNAPEEEIQEEGGQDSPLTGNIVSETFTSVTSFLTGLVTKETEIHASTKKGEPYTYENILNKNYSIKNINIDGENVSKDYLSTKEEGNNLIISTNYSIITKGFGEKYYKENSTNLTINLEDLNIELIPGNIEIILEYNDTQILYFSQELTEENLKKIELNNSVKELAQEIFNSTINNTIENQTTKNLTLTKEEKSLLKQIVDFPVVRTKVNTYRNKYLVDFEIGNFTMQKAYSNETDNESLKNIINQDQILWLKDIINSHNQKEQKIHPTNISYDYPIL